MNRTRKLLAGCALALAAPALILGCGGDSDEDPADVLRTALSKETDYESGVLNLGLSGSLEGAQSGSIEADVTGPFQQAEGEPVELGLTANAQVDAEGIAEVPGGSLSMDFSGGFGVADDTLWVDYQDQSYEASERLYSQVAPLLESAQEVGEQSQQTENPDEFIEALSNLENEGTEDIDGTSTTHISGDLDFASIVEQSGETVPFDTSQLEGLTGSVDVYVAEDDDTVRQMDFSFNADDVTLLQASGIEGASFTFSVGISEPNTEQTIEAPSDAQPLDDLLEQFGTSEAELATALEGGLQGFPGGGLDPSDLEGAGGDSADDTGSGDDSGPAEGAEPDLDELNDLADCLEDAGQDQAAIEDCLSQ